MKQFVFSFIIDHYCF